MGKPAVAIPGLRDFVRDLAKVNPKIRETVKRANRAHGRRVARRMGRRYQQTYTMRSGKGLDSIRSLNRLKGAAVRVGNKRRAPYTVAQNFGSDDVEQFSPRAARPDRFIYRSLVDEEDRLEAEYDRLLGAAVSAAFPDQGLIRR